MILLPSPLRRARAIPIVACLMPALLSACTNMSGLGGESEYGCKAPIGVHCDSVSGNYYNAIQNNLPGQRHAVTSKPSSAADLKPDQETSPQPKTAAPAPLAGMPLRSQARVVRLWFKPWEDADHDLYDQGYVYVQVDGGDWLIDHAQQRIRDAYAPIHPPRVQPSSTTSASGKSADSAAPENTFPAALLPSFSSKPASAASEPQASDKP